MIQRKYNDLLKEDESKFEELFMNDVIEALVEGSTVTIAGAISNESMDTRLKEIEIVDKWGIFIARKNKVLYVCAFCKINSAASLTLEIQTACLT